MSGPWQPPPWQPAPWQPAPWQPLPLPPVVPARYVPGGREPEPGDGGPRWPWVVVSVVAALVLVAGVVVALVLSGTGVASRPVAAPQRAGSVAPSAPPLLYGINKRPVRLDSIPADVGPRSPVTDGGVATTGPGAGAAASALRFLGAVATRDWPTAEGLCAPEVRRAAAARAVQLGATPATVVGAAFYGDELRGQAIAGGALVSVEEVPSEYLVSVRLTSADGSVDTVTLWVTGEFTVQDWT